jgi:hypothetical protein
MGFVENTLEVRWSDVMLAQFESRACQSARVICVDVPNPPTYRSVTSTYFDEVVRFIDEDE